MGGVSTSGADGLNVELNLVPFIDLLSSLVLFLLLGAVWVQIASMQAAVESKKSARLATQKEPPKRVEVKVTRRGYELQWPAKAGLPTLIALKSGSYDRQGLLTLLTSAVGGKKINAGGVSATDDIGYGELVTAVDLLKESGLTAVAISTE